MRIVHCFRSPVGGILRHVSDLSRAQAAAGHQVGILCDSTTGGPLEDGLLDEISASLALGLVRRPMQRHVGPGDLAAAWRAFRAVRNMAPDVLHGHGAKGGAYARLFGTAMRLAGKPVARLYSPHGGSLHYDARAIEGRLFFTAEAMMGRLTDHILFVSRYEGDAYAAKIGVPRAPTSLVYNGLRDEEFVPVDSPPGAADFLYIGMMRDLKGPDLFIDALAETARRLGRPLSATMVGDGQDRARYIARVAALGLSDRIAFHPAMPARKAFALGRIMVVPSRAEALPYIVLEALAAGKPLIATAVGGIPEIFDAGSPALSAPSVPALTETMIEALGDEDAFLASMPATDDLKARFGVATMTGRIEAIYRDALDKRKMQRNHQGNL